MDLITSDQARQRFGISPALLLRWMRLGRLRPTRVNVDGAPGRKIWFSAGDIANAIEASSFEEPRSGKGDASMG